MPELIENRGEIQPTQIMLPGPLQAAQVELLMRQFDMRETVVFTYPETASAPKDAERYRKLASGLIAYDTELRLIKVEGNESFQIKATPHENALFDLLTVEEGRVVNRTTLYRTVFGEDKHQHNVDVHVSNLRKKLGPARGYIATRRGVGFYAVPDFELPLDP